MEVCRVSCTVVVCYLADACHADARKAGNDFNKFQVSPEKRGSSQISRSKLRQGQRDQYRRYSVILIGIADTAVQRDRYRRYSVIGIADSA